jgi:hypothetical protein
MQFQSKRTLWREKEMQEAAFLGMVLTAATAIGQSGKRRMTASQVFIRLSSFLFAFR